MSRNYALDIYNRMLFKDRKSGSRPHTLFITKREELAHTYTVYV